MIDLHIYTFIHVKGFKLSTWLLWALLTKQVEMLHDIKYVDAEKVVLTFGVDRNLGGRRISDDVGNLK